jgi:hypothetical protein
MTQEQPQERGQENNAMANRDPGPSRGMWFGGLREMTQRGSINMSRGKGCGAPSFTPPSPDRGWIGRGFMIARQVHEQERQQEEERGEAGPQSTESPQPSQLTQSHNQPPLHPHKPMEMPLHLWAHKPGSTTSTAATTIRPPLRIHPMSSEQASEVRQLKIWQKNCCKSLLNQSHVTNSLDPNLFELCLIQEPYIGPLSNTCAPAGWRVIYTPKQIHTSTLLYW